MADMTEGMRVIFEDSGPVFVCVGQDDVCYYFQEEGGKQKLYFDDQ